MSEIVMLPVEEVAENPNNPRRVIDKKSQKYLDLKNSIQGAGVQVPIQVRTILRGYELLDGARRLSAVRDLKLGMIPAINKGVMSDAEAFDLTFAANYGRDDLTLLEQVKAAEIMLAKHNGDTAAAASRLGLDKKTLLCRIRIGKMSPKILKTLDDPDYAVHGATPAHLDLIARYPQAVQEEIIDELDSNLFTGPVSDLQKALEEVGHVISAAPWVQTSTPSAVIKGLVDCTRCEKRTDHKNLLPLFEGEPVAKKARCLDGECWKRNLDAVMKTNIKEAQEKHGDELAVVFDASHGYTGNEERAAKEHFGAQVLNNYFGFNTFYAKPKPGAKPVFLVNGEHAGRVMYYAPEKRGGEGSGERGRPVEAPKSMKERRAGLESKRWCVVLNRLIEQVDVLKTVKLSLDQVAALAVVFGTMDKNPSADAADWKKRLPAELSNPGKGLNLFMAVRPVLLARLNWMGGITQLPKEYIEEARAVSKLLGLDLDALHAAVVKEIQEPKSWAGLKADGTPKEEGKAGEKKA